MKAGMKKDYSIEIMLYALGGVSMALAIATAVSIWFSLW
jgi:hypothetical protein